MRKKKKQLSTNRSDRPRQIAPKSKKGPKIIFMTAALGVGLVLTGIYFLYQKETPQKISPELTRVKKVNVQLRETRNTLPPERFRGRVYVAYQTAREIPEVLDQLYCYCRCRENFGHKNLLSCYVDTHAST